MCMKRADTVAWLFMSVAIVLGAATEAAAQFAATPPLRNVSSTSMHICRVDNNNQNGGLPVVAVVKLINIATGNIDCQQTLTLSPFNTRQVTCTGAAVRYCEVDAQSNTLVDGLIVNLYLADNSSSAYPVGSTDA